MHFPCAAVFGLLCDPAWIQAGTSIALCILTVLTLIVLCIYARDTHKIAKTSVEQLNNSQMPFLALRRTGQQSSSNRRIADWCIENQGNSAAINITAELNTISDSYPSSMSVSYKNETLHLDPIPAGENKTIPNFP
jgi:hypothetical protein